jgi:hypothetical protein
MHSDSTICVNWPNCMARSHQDRSWYLLLLKHVLAVVHCRPAPAPPAQLPTRCRTLPSSAPTPRVAHSPLALSNGVTWQRPGFDQHLLISRSSRSKRKSSKYRLHICVWRQQQYVVVVCAITVYNEADRMVASSVVTRSWQVAGYWTWELYSSTPTVNMLTHQVSQWAVA